MPYRRPRLQNLPDVDLSDRVDGRFLAWEESSATHVYRLPEMQQIEDLEELLAGKADVEHTHVIDDVTGLQNALDGKAATVHLHDMGDVTGLVAALAGKSDVGHTHAQSDIAGLGAALSAKADASAVTTGLAGKADLVDGVIPTAQIPAIAISEFLGPAADETEMLALVGQRGDYCYRTDLESAMWLTADDPTAVGSWLQVAIPTVSVQSVNGQAGVVVLGYDDVDAAAASHTHLISDVTDLQSTLDSKAAASDLAAHVATVTGNPHGVTKSQIGLGSVSNDLQLKAAENLSDLQDVSAARGNLGLGAVALKSAITNSDIPALSGGTAAASLAISSSNSAPVTITRVGSGGVVINHVNSVGVGTWIGCASGSDPSLIAINANANDNFFQVLGGSGSALTLKSAARMGWTNSGSAIGAADTYLTRVAAGHIGLSGALQLGAAIADASAPVNSLFIGSAHSSKLCFKDASGTVRELY